MIATSSQMPISTAREASDHPRRPTFMSPGEVLATCSMEELGIEACAGADELARAGIDQDLRELLGRLRVGFRPRLRDARSIESLDGRKFRLVLRLNQPAYALPGRIRF